MLKFDMECFKHTHTQHRHIKQLLCPSTCTLQYQSLWDVQLYDYYCNINFTENSISSVLCLQKTVTTQFLHNHQSVSCNILKFCYLQLSVKNCFIRGSVIRYVQLPPEEVDTALLQDATRKELVQGKQQQQQQQQTQQT